jgi:hypothetical protein
LTELIKDKEPVDLPITDEQADKIKGADWKVQSYVLSGNP